MLLLLFGNRRTLRVDTTILNSSPNYHLVSIIQCLIFVKWESPWSNVHEIQRATLTFHYLDACRPNTPQEILITSITLYNYLITTLKITTLKVHLRWMIIPTPRTRLKHMKFTQIYREQPILGFLYSFPLPPLITNGSRSSFPPAHAHADGPSQPGCPEAYAGYLSHRRHPISLSGALDPRTGTDLGGT